MSDRTSPVTRINGNQPASARVHPDVILDGRLAIYHEVGDWLAVADLHYGYEVAQRDAGGLFPLWGMQRIEDRLAELCEDYSPATLILAGDIVHSGRHYHEGTRLTARLKEYAPEVIYLSGNHDRGRIRNVIQFRDSVSRDGFFLHHGHLDLMGGEGEITVTGHVHPAVNLSDGAGTRLKLPALVQEKAPDGREYWILPAFSPWAGGTARRPVREGGTVRNWLCSPKRVFSC